MKHPRNTQLQAFLLTVATDGVHEIWLDPSKAYLDKAEWEASGGSTPALMLAQPWTPEPHFGKSPCDCCDEPLAGNRYDAALNGRAYWGNYRHGEVSLCEDCYAFFASEGIVRTATHLTLTVYAVAQCWGGPEEGGWWYDWYSLPEPEAMADLLGHRQARLHIRVPVKVLGNYHRRQAVEEALKARARRAGFIFEGDTVHEGDWERKVRGIHSSRPEADARLVWEHTHGQSQSSERPHYC